MWEIGRELTTKTDVEKERGLHTCVHRSARIITQTIYSRAESHDIFCFILH